MDIYFFPLPPTSQEANWFSTVVGRGYFTWFHFKASTVGRPYGQRLLALLGTQKIE